QLTRCLLSGGACGRLYLLGCGSPTWKRRRITSKCLDYNKICRDINTPFPWPSRGSRGDFNRALTTIRKHLFSHAAAAYLTCVDWRPTRYWHAPGCAPGSPADDAPLTARAVRHGHVRATAARRR